MKTFLLVAATAFVVVGGGVATANHYDQYKNKQHQQEVTLAQKAKAAQAQADQAKQDLLVQANRALVAECQKGKVAYAKLPLSVQRVVPKPTCTATL